jgi:hypothetical protein
MMAIFITVVHHSSPDRKILQGGKKNEMKKQKIRKEIKPKKIINKRKKV